MSERPLQGGGSCVNTQPGLCTHTCACACAHTRARVHKYTNIDTCTSMQLHTHAHACSCTHTHRRLSPRTCAQKYTHRSQCTCAHILTFCRQEDVNINTHMLQYVISMPYIMGNNSIVPHNWNTPVMWS